MNLKKCTFTETKHRRKHQNGGILTTRVQQDANSGGGNACLGAEPAKLLIECQSPRRGGLQKALPQVHQRRACASVRASSTCRRDSHAAAFHVFAAPVVVLFDQVGALNAHDRIAGDNHAADRSHRGYQSASEHVCKTSSGREALLGDRPSRRGGT